MKMKTICGMSMRGAAYFGASVHICIGVIFFGLLLDRLVYHVYYKSLNVDTLRVDKESVIYFGLFFPLGILIFKAIDKENKALLKWAGGVFLALQLFGIIIRVKYGYIYSSSLLVKSRNPFPGSPKLESEITLENFKTLSLEIISTVAYLVTLYFYGRQLEGFPGRIYGQNGIPLYSTNSTYFVPSAPSEHHSHSHHSHHRNGRMTTPFSYAFEPPPPYSSMNSLACGSSAAILDGQGQVQFHQIHHGQHTAQQQPCSSRTMFANIARINKSFRKTPAATTTANLHSSNNTNPTAIGNPGGIGLITTTTTNHVNIGSNNNNNTIVVVTTNPNLIESDSPSAPLLETHRQQQNDESPGGGGRVVNGRNNSRNNSIVSNGKDVE